MLRAVRFAAILVFALAGGCTIDQPPPPAGNGPGTGECTVFADTLVGYTSGGATDPETGMRALGAPDAATANVTAGAVLTVGFVGLGGVIDNGDGDDILVHAVDATSDAVVAAYVGVDDEYIYIGELSASAPGIDLSKARTSVVTAVYVQLVGMSGAMPVDALESIETACDM